MINTTNSIRWKQLKQDIITTLRPKKEKKTDGVLTRMPAMHKDLRPKSGRFEATTLLETPTQAPGNYCTYQHDLEWYRVNLLLVHCEMTGSLSVVLDIS
jgi:hypothetical protein